MIMMGNVIWRLLRRNISIGQLAGYALANFAGLAIVITALQFYRDINTVMGRDDSFMSRDYLVVSHKVTGLGGLVGSGASRGFSSDEVADMESRPWVRRVGEFTPATFNVSAAIDMGAGSMSTALFFEAIPDEFLDVPSQDWTFDPEHPEIPIILNKDYLSLYNFGFASSRGLPRLSEAMMGLVPLRVSISGNGHQQWLPARIVGFSSRLNTIAVPEEFMRWANGLYGDTAQPAPSRLIVEVSRPGDPAIKEYLDANGYESADDGADRGKAAYFLAVVTAVVIGVGAVISLLAFFILMLSIYLLLQKNRAKLHDLMQLGYSPVMVSRYYSVIVMAVNAVVLVASLVTMFCVRAMWRGPLDAIGVAPVSPWVSVIVGVAAVSVVTVINIAAIRRKMSAYFRS
ncbi:MAG TPA: ABC transporter permease [Muribaculum sp.]|jgi:hypothetical protein|nr:ABC transporter permease [Heminiphilus faecis]HRF69651.1 ABC transporter permease [Muribaculum sp.]